MITGNKGEWSEIYVFLKLLADGKLNGADANLDAIPEVYYPIIKILREENNVKREYVIDTDIKIVDGRDNNELLSISLSTFVTNQKNYLTT